MGQLLDDAREQAEPALHAAEPPRLQDAQNAGRPVLGDRLRRHRPRRRRCRRALGEKGDQRPRPLHDRALLLRQRAVVAGKRNRVAARHGSSAGNVVAQWIVGCASLHRAPRRSKG